MFADTDIAASGEGYMSEQGKRPVIFLTLNDAKQTDMDSMVRRIGRIMARTYRTFPFLAESGSPLTQAEKGYFWSGHVQSLVGNQLLPAGLPASGVLAEYFRQCYHRRDDGTCRCIR